MCKPARTSATASSPHVAKDMTVEIDVPGRSRPEKSFALISTKGPINPILCVALVISLALAGAALGFALALKSQVDDLQGKVDRLPLPATTSTATTSTGVVPNVLLSTDAVTPAGYARSISLLTGSGSWAPGTDMPTERSDLQAITCAGKIVLLGGLNLSNVVVAMVQTFDPVSEVYSPATDMPTPRYRFGAACSGDLIYVAGGFADTATGNTGASLASVDVYNVTADTWSSAPDLQVPRGDLALAAVDGRIYAIGGYDHTYTERGTNEMLTCAAGTCAWSFASEMATAKGDLQAAVVDGLIYVPGGWNSAKTFLNELTVFNPAKNAWSTLASMHAPRGDKAVVALDGNIFALGGESWSGRTSTCNWGWGPIECAVNLIPMHGTEMYSPQDDVWTEMAPLPASRFRFAAAAYEAPPGLTSRSSSEGAFFAFGGHEHGEVAVKTQWAFHRVNQRALYAHVPFDA